MEAPTSLFRRRPGGSREQSPARVPGAARPQQFVPRTRSDHTSRDRLPEDGRRLAAPAHQPITGATEWGGPIGGGRGRHHGGATSVGPLGATRQGFLPPHYLPAGVVVPLGKACDGTTARRCPLTLPARPLADPATRRRRARPDQACVQTSRRRRGAAVKLPEELDRSPADVSTGRASHVGQPTIGSRGARRLGSSGTRLGVLMSVTTAPVHLSDRRPRRHRATLLPCPLASHCLSSATYPSVHVRILPLRGSSSPKTVGFTGLGAAAAPPPRRPWGPLSSPGVIHGSITFLPRLGPGCGSVDAPSGGAGVAASRAACRTRAAAQLSPTADRRARRHWNTRLHRPCRLSRSAGCAGPESGIGSA